MSLTATPTGEMPAQYTDCHLYGSERVRPQCLLCSFFQTKSVYRYCVDPDGNDVQILEEGESAQDQDQASEESNSSGEHAGQNCHFHAGVE